MTPTQDLKDALERRRTALGSDTTCFRWVDRDDVTVDLFDRVAILSTYREHTVEEEQALAEALAAATPLDAVYLKRRPREAKRAANEAPDWVAPPMPLVGNPVAPFLTTELGARFEIRPDNGLSVGLYLDARDARGWVRRHAKGRRVLNTFAYTCGFGVAARLGGAARAANVDVSRKVLDWGELNLAHNGFTADRFDFISGDSFEWLARFAKKGATFELVILDPPGFATTKSTRFTAHRDYHSLVAAAEQVVAPGGMLLAMCNVEAMSPAQLDEQVARGLGGRAAKTIARFGASELDFRRPPALKCAALELGPARRGAPSR